MTLWPRLLFSWKIRVAVHATLHLYIIQPLVLNVPLNTVFASLNPVDFKEFSRNLIPLFYYVEVWPVPHLPLQGQPLRQPLPEQPCYLFLEIRPVLHRYF